MCSIIGYLGSSISAQDLRAGFDKTISRGPDDTRMLHIGAATGGNGITSCTRPTRFFASLAKMIAPSAS